MSGAAVATPANILNIAFRQDKCIHNVILLQKSQTNNPLCTGKPLNFLYLTNGDDPDEILHNAAFHQSFHCLVRLKQS